MGKKTILYPQHLDLGAKMVDFAGWDMPIHYGSQIEEHQQVRQDAGIFDVSHMTVIDIAGAQAKEFLRYLLSNDVAKLNQSGQALYTALLNFEGAVLDDLIVYYLGDFYRLVVNCATREKDLAWIQEQGKDFQVSIDERPQLAILALQGPNARSKLISISDASLAAAVETLPVFHSVLQGEWLVARTGYTGEDGLEIILPESQVQAFWQQLLAAGFAPVGLGARDTLRLEAGMNLYGSDMDETVTPLQSNMAFAVSMNDEKRNFIGKDAILKQKQRLPNKLVGLVLEKGGVMRAHQKVFVAGEGEGEITSGSFSPTLKLSIALARIPVNSGDQVEVEIRGKRKAADVVKPPFVRNGKKVY